MQTDRDKSFRCDYTCQRHHSKPPSHALTTTASPTPIIRINLGNIYIQSRLGPESLSRNVSKARDANCPSKRDLASPTLCTNITTNIRKSLQTYYDTSLSHNTYLYTLSRPWCNYAIFVERAARTIGCRHSTGKICIKRNIYMVVCLSFNNITLASLV
jgi:hypothetical protein